MSSLTPCCPSSRDASTAGGSRAVLGWLAFMVLIGGAVVWLLCRAGAAGAARVARASQLAQH